jgi:DNA-binding transcriptional LysR family regulator
MAKWKSLNDMALFVEVVKAKSFRRAAEAIGVPNSTLSRRISALEKAIGLPLLHRTTRKIELTEAGQLYFERSRRIVDEARLAHERCRWDVASSDAGVAGPVGSRLCHHRDAVVASEDATRLELRD